MTAVQRHGGVVTKDVIEAMHRTESVQVATRQRGAGATGFNQNFEQEQLTTRLRRTGLPSLMVLARPHPSRTLAIGLYNF